MLARAAVASATATCLHVRATNPHSIGKSQTRGNSAALKTAPPVTVTVLEQVPVLWSVALTQRARGRAHAEDYFFFPAGAAAGGGSIPSGGVYSCS